MAENWEKIGFIRAGKHRQSILGLLKEPKTPTEIAQKLDVSTAQVSRTLRELIEKKYIVCLNSNAKKGRLYKKV